MGDIFSALGDAIGSILNEIAAVIAYIFQVLVVIAQFIWDSLVLVANFFLQIVQDVAKFFDVIWNQALKPIFSAILQGIVKFGQWLQNIFGPVVKFLKQVSKYIDKIYNTYVKPFLKILRIARIFLQLLRALGIKWAADLDKILGQVQADIQRAFLTIKGYLNVIIDLLNILADPSNLIRRPTTLLSLMRVFHASVRMFTGLPPGFFMPANKAGTPYGLGFLPANFDPSNPLQNPPPSYYLAFDGGVQDYSFLAPGETIGDDAQDSLQALEYFTDTVDDITTCGDADACRDEAIRLAIQGV